MKRVIWAVIAVGFLVVSCGGGGGNIKKVQNGVFSDFDNTITVGKALENNKFLKGGKWKAIEMNGRDYVTYTVKLTRSQAEEFMTAILPQKSKPNYGTASSFYRTLNKWSYYAEKGDADALAKMTSMSAEEVKQAIDIIKPEVKSNEKYLDKEDIEQMLTINGYEMILSFVMNQDGSFNINMLETYAEVTLNCFKNLKVRFNAQNIKNAQNILDFIYSARASETVLYYSFFDNADLSPSW